MTDWNIRHTVNRSRWLLMNGDIVNEPLLEQTPSGSRVRLPGTNESHYKRNAEDLIERGIDEAAKRKRTAVWMPLDDDNVLQTALGYTPGSEPAVFDLPKSGVKARVWWRFRHKNLPIEAVLTITLKKPYTSQTGHNLTTTLATPFTLPSKARRPEVLIVRESTFSIHGNKVSSLIDDAAKATFEQFVQRNPAEWATILEQHEGLLEGPAVAALLKQARAAEELASIEIPDLRDPDNPGWLTLDLHDSNISGQFLSDLTEYLDSATATEKVAALYEEMVDTLQGCGLAVPTKIGATQFMRALLTGDTSTLTAELSKASVGAKEQDAFHVLSVHLPTGTFVVTCKREVEDKDEVALAWEESLLRAEVTGQKDTLLAYAEQYAARGHKDRAKTIIRQRQELLT